MNEYSDYDYTDDAPTGVIIAYLVVMFTAFCFGLGCGWLIWG